MIAHRGASLLAKENSMEALIKAAQMGSDAVECDLRVTKDLQYILFHDGDLKRLAGLDRKVSDLTLEEMRHVLSMAGHTVATLADLLSTYGERVPILLHSKLERLTDTLLELLLSSPVKFILGVTNVRDVALCRRYLPKEQILAFMPKKEDAASFVEAGAGILRLWENWLSEIGMQDVKKAFDAEVWIMSNHPVHGMNGSRASLDFLAAQGADGVLLNDIALGLAWRKERTTCSRNN